MISLNLLLPNFLTTCLIGCNKGIVLIVGWSNQVTYPVIPTLQATNHHGNISTQWCQRERLCHVTFYASKWKWMHLFKCCDRVHCWDDWIRMPINISLPPPSNSQSHINSSCYVGSNTHVKVACYVAQSKWKPYSYDKIATSFKRGLLISRMSFTLQTPSCHSDLAAVREGNSVKLLRPFLSHSWCVICITT